MIIPIRILELRRMIRIPTRKWLLRILQSMAMVSEATAKSSWEPRERWFWIAKRKPCSTRSRERPTRPVSKRKGPAQYSTHQPVVMPLQPRRPKGAGPSVVVTAKKSSIGLGASARATTRTSLVAMVQLLWADAVIALTAKQAIQQSQTANGSGYIRFQPEWFDVNSDAVPEASGIEENRKLFVAEKKSLGLV
jgi:hypothetical protein